jgi:hypothetical protein
MRRTSWSLKPVALGLTTLAVGACGGSSNSSSSATRSRPATTTRAAAKSSSATGSQALVTTGPVRAMLRAPTHTPVVGKNWTYTITATDAAGHPLNGTVLSEFAFAGQVVGREAPPTHRLKHGRLRDVIQYPARSVGVPLTFYAVVETRLGKVTLKWPIKVRR